jgi:hypothetical protein
MKKNVTIEKNDDSGKELFKISVTIEKQEEDGSLIVTHLWANCLFKKLYYGCTEKEAIVDFMEHFKQTKD